MASINVPHLLATTPTRLFIDGQWLHAQDGATVAVVNPATGEVLTQTASASPADGRAALDAAVAAQSEWATAAPRTRGDLLLRAHDLLVERTEQFATLITLEMGKPLPEARGEVAYAAEFLRWFAEESVRVAGRYQAAPDGRSRLLTIKRPVGPCLFITPWNFPLAMAARKISPALAAGCTSVLKPAAQTPLTALAFAALLAEVGVPAGVVNVIPTAHAQEVTAPLIADRRLRKLSFTGSTTVGRALLRQAADNVLRTSMELGGNAPFLVFDDADLDAAVAGATAAKLRNMGEACTAANRFFVHEAIAGEFCARLAEVFASLSVADGLSDGAQIGPLIDGPARDGVHELVTDAVAQGAIAATGGELLDGSGYFYPATVLTNVPADARVLHEEIFGPVAPVATFRTEAEAVALANDSEYGLAGYVFTRDLARVLRMSEQIEVGMLGVNQGVISNPAAPFGGVKHSGLGREGGVEGIEEFLETVYVNLPDPTAAG
ncbi:NAD-dependent succinate-semialdehyde dehydrogenase [Micromonospora sp. NBC_01412]|uniref:NAD-dependent succinate-semialdehyde dehydrogenase n=1 Tax=Micromonospora sp. NBC_01412 TaxID=2903590 RepID=UPI00324F7AE8